MAFAPLTEYDAETVKGRFVNTETKVTFEYSTSTEAPLNEGYPHKVWLFNGEFRWAKVVATRAYVVVDEAADGSPVVEKWLIRSHKVYR